MRTHDEIMADLVATTARVRRLRRQQETLVAEALAAGTPQTALARVLEVAQSTISRFKESAAPAAGTEVVEAFEAGEIDQTRLVEALVALPPGPLPAVDRAVLRGTLPPPLVRRVLSARNARRPRVDVLRELGTDHVYEASRVTVLRAAALLRAASSERRAHDGTPLWESLVLRERALSPSDVDGRAELLADAETIVRELGSES